jgi:pSer/pThr/pTyr-binding forkhead associated (FHA) protein
MKLQLVVDKGDGRRQVLRLPQEDAIVGRALGSTVRVPSAEVSRRHCRLRREGGFVTVEDLDSENGTFLNGRPVNGTQLVRPGDRLEIGPVRFVVEYELGPEAQRRLQESAGSDLETPADGNVFEDLEEYEELAEGEELREVEEIVEEGEEILEEELVVEEDQPLPMTDESGEPMEFDNFSLDDANWQMPSDGDLRDLLAEMDRRDGESTPDEE